MGGKLKLSDWLSIEIIFFLYRNNSFSKKTKKSKPRKAGNSLQRDKIVHTDSGKKFVTFGNTHFVENTSLSGQSANSGSDNQEKPDLPGRVSFSKSDVYEIDFSDYENDNEMPTNFSTSASKTSLNKLVRTSSNAIKSHQEEDCNQDLQGFCCSLKCNSMASTIDESDMGSTDKSSTKNENADHPDTNAVIEDYKKEIESLNRTHEMDIAEKEETIDSVSLSPTKHDVPRLQFTHYGDNEGSPGDTANITKKYNDKTAFNNSKSLNLVNLKPLNNNGQTTEHNSKSTSNEVINNYLKATKQNDIYAQSTSKQNNLSKAPTMTQTKLSKKTKPPPHSEKIKPKPKQGDNLDEFQIEKVESWMSIHEKSFSNSKCDIVERGAYNNEWRETPISKTDDEGNFSFEDPIDDVSNEESNYDEIVSVIKEIDEEKSKDLGKLMALEVLFTIWDSENSWREEICFNGTLFDWTKAGNRLAIEIVEIDKLLSK